MPCRSEKSVATVDQRGKSSAPLIEASERNNTEDHNDDADRNSDDVATAKIEGQTREELAGRERKQRHRKPAGNPAGEENKENDTKSAGQGEGRGQEIPAGKSSGVCRGEKSVQVKDTIKSDGKMEQARDRSKLGSAQNVGAGSEDSPTSVNKDNAPKKSTGFCRSDKDVEVIDASHSQQGKPDEDASNDPRERPRSATGSSTDMKDRNSKDKVSPGKQSGGFCRKNTDVAVKDSTTKLQGEPFTKSEDKSSATAIAAETESANQKSAGVGPTKSANQKPPAGRSGTCCGGRSVEIKESLRPLDKPDSGAEPEPRNIQDDSFGEPIHSGLDDLVGEEDNTPEKEMSEESFEEIDDDDDDDSDSKDVIIVKPEPPPPKIKKKKKGKKEKGLTDYVEDSPNKGGPLSMNPRKGKYSVTSSAPEQEEEPLYAQVERTPTKKKQTQVKLGDASGVESKDTPTKRKKKKRLETETQDDIRSAYENQIASLAATSGSEGGFTLNDHPTVEEESELLENAEAERKKNKQRLREKKLRETGGESPVKKGDATNLAYENAQREIDKVLAPKIIAEDQDVDSEGSGKKKKKGKDKSKKKKKEKNKGEDNEAYSSDERVEESLEEAKAKMHQLLDDAFSLFSHSRSSISNKVAPAKQSSEENNSPRDKDKRSPRNEGGSKTPSPRDSSKKASPREEEKKHTPMNIIRSHEPYDKSGLVTWDPYRASDETAVISLPSTQTNLSSQPPHQEKLTTSTFTESLPGSLRPNYFATQPAEPIVIKSSELGDSNRHPPMGRDFYTSPRNHTGSPVPPHGTFQNPLYDDSYRHANPTSQPSGVRAGSRHAPPYHQQPIRPTDRHYEPYYGLSSFQEIPQASTIPGQVDQRDPNPHHRDIATLNSVGTLDYRNPTYSDSFGRGSKSLYNGYQQLEMTSRPGTENTSSAQNDLGRTNERQDRIMSHTAPQRGENPNMDMVDAVSGSLRPGASPQPLINSLREELQTLASKKGTKIGSSTVPLGATNGASRNNGFQSLR